MTVPTDLVSLPKYLTSRVTVFVMVILACFVGMFIATILRINQAAVLNENPLGSSGLLAITQNRLQNEMGSLQDYLVYMHGQSEQDLKEQLQAQVVQAHGHATYLYNRFQDTLSQSELQSLLVETLRRWRFKQGRGYLFIDDMQGLCILLPSNPSLEGMLLKDNQDDQGTFIMRAILDAVKNPEGAGFARYRWYMPYHGSQMYDKVSYIKYFEPMDWVIGAGDYLEVAQQEIQAKALQRVASMNIGQRGAFTVLDKAGHILYSPTIEASAERQHYTQAENLAFRSLMREMLLISQKGGGFSEYDWFENGNDESITKLALVQDFEPWGWVVIADMYPDEDQIEQAGWLALSSPYVSYIKQISGVTIAVIILLVGLVWRYRLALIKLQQGVSSQASDAQLAFSRTRQELDIAACVFDTSREGIMVTDADNLIVATNPAFTKITGYEQSSVLGKNPRFLSSGQQTSEFYRALWSSLAVFDQWQGEIWNRTKQGDIYLQQMAISVFRDDQKRIKNYIATFSDRSEHVLAEQQLKYLAEYDDLTGLPNRRLLHDRVKQYIDLSEQRGMQKFSLLFIDLDRFKNINDSLGHNVGDVVLKQIAERLNSIVRDVDSVARIGGDEFAILLTVRREEVLSAAANLSERLMKSLSAPIYSDDLELTVTPSIGITLFPDDGNTADTLFRNADTALYHAKEQGRNNYQFYSVEMNEKASSRLRVEHGLRQALEHQEFFLAYQPLYSLIDGRVTGCEALIRWKHEGKLMPPAEFIPLAEEVGLINGIGDWVLHEACRQGAYWREAGVDIPCISVNVSGAQFKESLLTTVTRALEKTGFPGESLVLELTETALMLDTAKTERILLTLQKMGVRIALDDFGTGYSSLAYLKRFPIDKLKIDRAFIDGLPHDSDDKAITASILDVSRHLGLETVAEGVETQEQAAYLTANGCDVAQGYFYSYPLSPDELETVISKSNAI